jgi:hypothetical protein
VINYMPMIMGLSPSRRSDHRDRLLANAETRNAALSPGEPSTTPP